MINITWCFKEHFLWHFISLCCARGRFIWSSGYIAYTVIFKSHYLVAVPTNFSCFLIQPRSSGCWSAAPEPPQPEIEPWADGGLRPACMVSIDSAPWFDSIARDTSSWRPLQWKRWEYFMLGLAHRYTERWIQRIGRQASDVNTSWVAVPEWKSVSNALNRHKINKDES